MDSNKENVFRVPATKIPIPKEPLPPLPNYLITTKMEEHLKLRCPLQTLNETVENTTARINHVSFRCTQLNTKFVTIRQKHIKMKEAVNLKPSQRNEQHVRENSELTKKLKVMAGMQNNFLGECSQAKNFVGESSQAKNFVAESSHTKNFVAESSHTKNFVAESSQAKSFLGEYTQAVTPAIQHLETEAKNIKKSLKRPHSRKLLGLSPVQKAQKADERAKRRLYFSTSQDQDLQIQTATSLIGDYAEDIFPHLLLVETKLFTSNCHKRACLIDWLVKINKPEGDPGVIQTAVRYFDSFVIVYNIPTNKLHLFATACYWIARKVCGPLISSTKLVIYANNVFNKNDLMRAEKIVLKKLMYPQKPVVPQDFIAYLAWWCDPGHPGLIQTAATFLCMSGLIIDPSLSGEYPSVLAVAAVKEAAVLFGKDQYFHELHSRSVYKEIVKKSENIKSVSIALRNAIQIIAHPNYKYKALLEYFSCPPYYVTKQILSKVSYKIGNNNIS